MEFLREGGTGCSQCLSRGSQVTLQPCHNSSRPLLNYLALLFGSYLFSWCFPQSQVSLSFPDQQPNKINTLPVATQLQHRSRSHSERGWGKQTALAQMTKQIFCSCHFGRGLCQEIKGTGDPVCAGEWAGIAALPPAKSHGVQPETREVYSAFSAPRCFACSLLWEDWVCILRAWIKAIFPELF